MAVYFFGEPLDIFWCSKHVFDSWNSHSDKKYKFWYQKFQFRYPIQWIVPLAFQVSEAELTWTLQFVKCQCRIQAIVARIPSSLQKSTSNGTIDSVFSQFNSTKSRMYILWLRFNTAPNFLCWRYRRHPFNCVWCHTWPRKTKKFPLIIT